ncbi:MAG: hypothetical protein R3D85_02180 [Paracoccaceae bacterium]
MTPKAPSALSLAATPRLPAATAAPTGAQTVLSGDHSITGNLCRGRLHRRGKLGSYPLRLKGGILGIESADTSTGPFQPTHDWALMINDRISMARLRFPSMTARPFQVFKIEGYAPANSVYVDDELRRLPHHAAAGRSARLQQRHPDAAAGTVRVDYGPQAGTCPATRTPSS